MRTFNLLFPVIGVLAVLQSALFFFRGLTTVFDYDGYIRMMWLFKIITYAGILVLCFFVFRTRLLLHRRGLFHQTSTRHLRVVCLLGLALAFTNSIANALMHLWEHYHKILPWSEVRSRFLLYLGEEIADQSILTYLLLLALFLLASFSESTAAPDRAA